MEQVRTLLTMREQLTRERTAKQNARRMLARKVVQTPLANRIADDAVSYLKDRIAEIDREVRRSGGRAPDDRSGRGAGDERAGRGAAPRLAPLRGDGRLLAPAPAEAGLGVARGSVPWSTRVEAVSVGVRGAGLRPVGDPEAALPGLDPARLHRGLAVPHVLPPEEGGGEERFDSCSTTSATSSCAWRQRCFGTGSRTRRTT